jgi:hypothetical protein
MSQEKHSLVGGEQTRDNRTASHTLGDAVPTPATCSASESSSSSSALSVSVPSLDAHSPITDQSVVKPQNLHHIGHDDHYDTCSPIQDTDESASYSNSVGAQGQLATVRLHALMLALIAANYAQMDMEKQFVYFLLADTSYGCNITEFYASIMTITYLANIGWRPISGYLTDRTSHSAQHVLVCSTAIQLVTEVTMYTLHAAVDHVWIIAALQVIRNLAEVQTYNSIWKIFKMRLDQRFSIRVGAQCRLISTVALWGEFSEILVNAATLGFAYYLMINNYSYATVRWVFCGTSTAYTVVLLCLAMNVGSDYFQKPASESHDDIHNDTGVYDDGRSPLLQQTTTSSSETSGSLRSRKVNQEVSASASDMQRIECKIAEEEHAPLLHSNEQCGWPDEDGQNAAFKQHQNQKQDQDQHQHQHQHSHYPELGFWSPHVIWEYIRENISYLYRTDVARTTIFHSFIVYLAYSVMSNAETLSLPGRGVEPMHMRTTENFCGGFLTNTIYQTMFINGSYLVGTAFFLVILKRISPVVYFRIGFPLFCIGLLGASVVIFFNVSQTFLSIFLGLLLAFLWFFYVYDTFLVTAVISHEQYGFYSFINGEIQTLSNLMITFMYHQHVNNRVFLYMAYAILVCSFMYSLRVAYVARRALKHVSVAFC